MGKDLDRDRCIDTWENLYISCYSKLDFWKEVRFSRYDKETGTLKISDDITISGDTLFNFKDYGDEGTEYKHGPLPKYRRFLKYLTDNEDIEKLNKCRSEMYNMYNFILLPSTGGLNIFKAGLSGNLDRPDTFIYEMNNFFSSGARLDHYIFKKSTEVSKLKLHNYLIKNFDNIYDFCKYFMLIYNKNIVDTMIYHGKLDLDTADHIRSYINLASIVWEHRKQVIQQSI